MKIETTSGRASESGHWYSRDGTPIYEIRGANGLMRAVTLRDARKLNLLPGYSSIAAMEYRHLLVNWQIEQALLSAITLPRLADETDDQFVMRAREDSKEQARKAAERGTAIHAAIQSFYEGKSFAPEFDPYVIAVNKYLLEKFGAVPWIAERSFAHELGYGGKVDLHSVKVVVDLKGKDFDETAEVDKLAWPENAMQLISYANGLSMIDPICLNIFFSRTVPGLIRVKIWDAVELDTAWDAFRCLHRLWCLRRGYFPAFVRTQAA